MTNEPATKRAHTSAGMPNINAEPNAAARAIARNAGSPSFSCSIVGTSVIAAAESTSPEHAMPKLIAAKMSSGISASFFIRLKRKPGVIERPTSRSVAQTNQMPERSATAFAAVSRA